MKYIFLSIAFLFTYLTNTAQMSTPSISASGKSTVYVIPDEALISFSIITQSDDIQEAKNENSSIASSTISFLKKQGIDSKYIQTQYLQVGKNYRHQRNPQNEKKFSATQNISVCVSDLDRLDDIMSGLLELEISNINGPNFRTSELEKYEEEALLKALEDAKQKAEKMSNVYDASLGIVLHITEQSGSTPMFKAYAENRSMAMDSSGSEPSFAAGQLEVTAKVQVEFSLNQ